MPCYHPLKAFQAIIDQDTMKRVRRQAVFNEAKLDPDIIYKPQMLACRQCIGCRLDYSRVWALRSCHEASLHEQNSFITLTIDPDSHSDLFHNLSKPLFAGFMKRLREFASRRLGKDGIRVLYCGEYGKPTIDPDFGVIERFRHAHYHAVLFNFDFSDKELFTVRNGLPLYRSAILEKLWPYGFSSIGSVTFDSCAYVARYVTKKITGKDSEFWYGDNQPEFMLSSRRPGIAREWINKFYSDVYPKDFITFNKGLKLRPPRYYDKVFDVIDSEMMNEIKLDRDEKMEEVIITPEYVEQHTPERLSAKEEVQLERFSRLVRSLEI